MTSALDVGTLSGRIELEDRFSNVLDQIGGAIGKFDDSWKGAATRVAEGALSFLSAEAALGAVKEAAHLVAETLKEITLEGSHAADIEGTFDHLTASAGLAGDTLLGKMRDGLRGTVTDMDLMTRVNQNLAVGLNLTEGQMGTLSNAAFAISKAYGIDAASAMDRLSDAMVTGRTRGIALLTGKIDLVAAEDAYAAKLGTTTDHLTEQGKQAAIQDAIMTKLEQSQGRLGDTTIRLADKIQQVKVEFANFEEELGTAIATSPVINAGFDSIRGALEGAFGSNQQERVRNIALAIDDAAIQVIDFAEDAVNAAGVVGVEWNAAKVVFGDIAQIVDGDAVAFEYLSKGVAELGSLLHLPGAAENVKRIDDNIQSLMETMVERGKSIQSDKDAEASWASATGQVNEKLEEAKAKMVAARQSIEDYTGPVRDVASAENSAAVATTGHTDAASKNALVMSQTREEAKKFAEALKDMDSAGQGWQGTLNGIDGTVVEAVKFYLDAGVAQDKLAAAYGLTANQVKSVAEARKEELETLKAEAVASESIEKMYIDYYAKKQQLEGTDTQKAIAAADADYQKHVEELAAKGVQDIAYYTALGDLRNKDVAMADEARLLGDANSKASKDKKIADAQDYLDFQRRNYDQYTDADREAQEKVIADLKQVRAEWGKVGDQTIKVGQDGKVTFDMLSQANAAFAAGMDASKIKVKLLDDEIVSLDEAQKRLSAGGSFTYDLTNQQGVEQYRAMNQGMSISWSDAQIIDFAKKGGTLQQLMQMGVINMAPLHSFAEGGAGDFGSGTLAMLHGKEVITPIDKVGGMGGPTLIFNVNGTGVQVAQTVKDILMRELKTVKQFGAA